LACIETHFFLQKELQNEINLFILICFIIHYFYIFNVQYILIRWIIRIILLDLILINQLRSSFWFCPYLNINWPSTYLTILLNINFWVSILFVAVTYKIFIELVKQLMPLYFVFTISHYNWAELFKDEAVNALRSKVIKQSPSFHFIAFVDI
jgi:hypothetical protein